MDAVEARLLGNREIWSGPDAAVELANPHFALLGLPFGIALIYSSPHCGQWHCDFFGAILY